MENIIIKKDTPFKERYHHVHNVRDGIWYHYKTGQEVTVIGRVGYDGVKLKHASGRITVKRDHYFIGDYYNTK